MSEKQRWANSHRERQTKIGQRQRERERVCVSVCGWARKK